MLIFVIISMLFLFIIPLMFLLITDVNYKRFYIPYIAGILIYLLGVKLIQTAIVFLVARMSSFSGLIYNTRVGYGLFMSLSVVVPVELIRVVILLLADRFFNWENDSNNYVAVGVGQGWITGVFSWGLYMWHVIYGVVNGTSIDYYGLEPEYMTAMLFERFFAIILYVALTFMIQMGITKGQIFRYFGLAILIHLIGEFMIYALPYILGASMLVTEFLYGIYAVAVIFVIFYKKLNLKKQ